MSSRGVFGRNLALGLFIFGLFATGANALMIWLSGYFLPKTLIMGITSIILSLSLFVAPGNSPSLDTPKDIQARLFWQNSSTVHKIIWVIFGLIGLVIGFVVVVRLSPEGI